MAHPLYGLGALHAKIDNLDERMDKIEATQTDADLLIKDLEERTPFTVTQAESQRDELRKSENRKALVSSARTTVWEKVVSAVIASALTGYLVTNLSAIAHQFQRIGR
ncbi:MAG: hypothetical protein LC754_10405 [Acidobacteria bacterium]|nr:hypothetical protein [Acidobacteriota bacterium]